MSSALGMLPGMLSMVDGMLDRQVPVETGAWMVDDAVIGNIVLCRYRLVDNRWIDTG